MVTRLLERSAIDSAKKGSADLLILALVDEQALHGYDIARRIEERSDGTLRFTLASLYATLYRLEERGLDSRALGGDEPGNAAGATTGSPTTAGQVLATQREEWGRFIAALTQVAGVKPA